MGGVVHLKVDESFAHTFTIQRSLNQVQSIRPLTSSGTRSLEQMSSPAPSFNTLVTNL